MANGDVPKGRPFGSEGWSKTAASSVRTWSHRPLCGDGYGEARARDLQGNIAGPVQEGKGAVAQGQLAPDGTFVADEVLAPKQSLYMPPEAAAAMAKARASGANAQQIARGS